MPLAVGAPAFNRRTVRRLTLFPKLLPALQVCAHLGNREFGAYQVFVNFPELAIDIGELDEDAGDIFPTELLRGLDAVKTGDEVNSVAILENADRLSKPNRPHRLCQRCYPALVDSSVSLAYLQTAQLNELGCSCRILLGQLRFLLIRN